MTGCYALSPRIIVIIGLLAFLLCCTISSASEEVSDFLSNKTGNSEPYDESFSADISGPAWSYNTSDSDFSSQDLNGGLPEIYHNDDLLLPQPRTIISGYVFKGSAGSRSETLEGVPVELFCSSTPDDPGAAVIVTRTDSAGKYEINVEDSCGYYTIAAFPPGMVTRAESEQGVIIEGNRILFTSPLTRSVIVENNFWADYPKPGDAPLFWNSGGLVLLWMGMFVIGFIIIILGLGVLKGKNTQTRKK